MFRYLFFDLDGTLLNTYLGISRTLIYAMDALGIPVPDEKGLYKYMGPPLRDSFVRLAGLSEDAAEAAVKKFRERYDTVGAYEYSFFEPLDETLTRLREMGYVLSVATGKPEVTAREILKHAGIDKYFSYIGGSTLTSERTSKAAVIEYVVNQLKISDKSEILMIGDRDNDVLGARENGIVCCGVLCGYGSREELEGCNAEYIIGNISDIFDILR